MNKVTSLGDDVRGVLYRGHLAYVVNSKSICEFSTLYFYKIYVLSTLDGSKFIEIKYF